MRRLSAIVGCAIAIATASSCSTCYLSDQSYWVSSLCILGADSLQRSIWLQFKALELNEKFFEGVAQVVQANFKIDDKVSVWQTLFQVLWFDFVMVYFKVYSLEVKIDLLGRSLLACLNVIFTSFKSFFILFNWFLISFVQRADSSPKFDRTTYTID